LEVDLQFNDVDNILLNLQTDPTKPIVATTEGGYEALFYDDETDTFSGVVEAVSLSGVQPDSNGDLPKGGDYHAVIDELKFDAKSGTYTKQSSCPSDFEFSSANKGFEGAIRIKTKQGEVYVLGLCEGNFCQGGPKGREPGNGRLIVLKRVEDTMLEGQHFDCVYETQQVINLPKSVNFVDYSSIARRGDKIAIASQESSRLWVGKIDLVTFEVIDGGHHIYDFPRNDNCEIVYCNIEGIDFINDNMLIAASDQMKSGGRQSFRCLAKDQSVHVFVIPPEPERVM
jgi:hypothetical protein